MMRVQARNLKKSYFHGQSKLQVLNGINLDIHAGSVVSLTGASGVGKSTLLHILGTLDTPTSGEVLWNGINISRGPSAATAAFRNENIGFVFQFHHLLPEFTALENVSVPLRIRRKSNEVAAERARDVLTKVGLAHRLDHKPGELSGGEQQRVALARAIVTRPKLLLADEPTGNLDEATSSEIMDLVYRLNKEQGITVLLVTHNTRLAQRADLKLVLTNHGMEIK